MVDGSRITLLPRTETGLLVSHTHTFAVFLITQADVLVGRFRLGKLGRLTRDQELYFSCELRWDYWLATHLLFSNIIGRR